jgi:ribokinase
MHDFNFDNISTKWIYLTSLGKQWQNAYDKTLNYIKKTGALLAFNPGTLQIEGGKDNIAQALLATQLLFVNKEEAEELLDLSSDQKDIEDLIKELKKLGPKIAVITDGQNGSFTINDKGETLRENIVNVDVIEKTGAGDAYSSGFLSALIKGKTIANSMEWGTKNATSVIGKTGAQAGLLQKADLEQI